MDAVYLDTVPQRRSLWKLKDIGGLRGKILEWMQDYLKDRELKTVIRDVASNWRNVTSGVRVSLSTHNVPGICK